MDQEQQIQNIRIAITPLQNGGNATLGVVARASRALAVGYAEQAAFPSKAAGRHTKSSRRSTSAVTISTYLIEFFRSTIAPHARLIVFL
jgi:acetaldehyde dehydrogenase (acetylating)